MAFWSRIKYSFKIGIRSKELYVYIIGFPLIFLLIYGSLAGSAYTTTQTTDIGFINLDNGASIDLGSLNYSFTAGNDFYKYLDSLRFESTGTKMYNIENLTSIDEAKRKVSNLELAVAIIIPENFTWNLLNFSKTITFTSLIAAVNKGVNEAYREGNTTLANIYMDILNEISEFSNSTFELKVVIYGDPTYSKAMNTYEAMWGHLVSYASQFVNRFMGIYLSYIQEKYNVKLEIRNNTIGDFSKTFNVDFEVIGETGQVKKSFLERYYSVLVPGQIIQSIMLSAVSAIYITGNEMEKGILNRLKLTKIKSSEYIGSTIVSWGLIALFQSTIMLGISLIMGYIKPGGNPINYVIAVSVLAMSGMLSASVSLIVISFVEPKIAGTISLIVLLVSSLYIAGYFPVPNSTIGHFLGRPFTALDIFPWRASITALRKSLMLSNQIEPLDVLPDLALLTIWLTVYTASSFYVFEKTRMRKSD